MQCHILGYDSLNASLSAFGTDVARQYISVRLLHFANVSEPIFFTPVPIVTFVSPVQPLNASYPILVTLLGISMLVRSEQYSYLQPVVTQYFASNKSEIWS